MTDLVVLAGGFGTRLRSAVGDVPKPLAPVAGRPYLDYLIDSWLEQGVAGMTFMLHHQHELIEEFLAEKRREPGFSRCKVDVFVEDQPLGTGGAVGYAVKSGHLGDSFLVANADTWLGSGIAALAQASQCSIGIVAVDDAGRYGRVETSGERVTAFREKTPEPGGGWINAGLCHLSAADFAGWDGKAMSLEQDVFPGLVQKSRLSAVPLYTQFIDIGIPADYMRFCRWVEAGRAGAP
jgi:D-glycero-alpha-D-manno-heptose 1-phosphate guanylyltransferase